jgi:hypothetical protein
VVGTRAFRRQQHEHEVDGLLVDGVVIDRAFEAREHADDLLDVRKAAVGNGDPLPHAGGTEALALGQRFKDLAFGDTGQLCRACREFLEKLLLAVNLQRRDDRIRRKHISDVHVWTY